MFAAHDRAVDTYGEALYMIQLIQDFFESIEILFEADIQERNNFQDIVRVYLSVMDQDLLKESMERHLK